MLQLRWIRSRTDRDVIVKLKIKCPHSFPCCMSTHDEIVAMSFIKLTLSVTLPFITHLLDSIVTTSEYPDLFKMSKDFYEHKDCDAHELKDHRGIHIYCLRCLKLWRKSWSSRSLISLVNTTCSLPSIHSFIMLMINKLRGCLFM